MLIVLSIQKLDEFDFLGVLQLGLFCLLLCFLFIMNISVIAAVLISSIKKNSQTLPLNVMATCEDTLGLQIRVKFISDFFVIILRVVVELDILGRRNHQGRLRVLQMLEDRHRGDRGGIVSGSTVADSGRGDGRY